LSEPIQNLGTTTVNSPEKTASQRPLYQRAGVALALIILVLLHPAVKYALPFAILIAYILARGAKLDRRSRLFLFCVFIGAVLLRAIFAVAVQWAPLPKAQSYWFPDEHSYRILANAVARAWHQGEFPTLSKDVWLGTLHTGYYRILATLYYLFGDRYWLGICVNILMGATVPLLLYFLADSAFGKRAARLAAIVAALYPSFIFWSGFLLKDSVHAAFFMLALVACWDLREKWRDLPALALLAASFFLALLRAYSTLIVWASLAGYLILFSKKRTVYLAVTLWIMLVYAIARQTYVVSEYEKNLIFSFLNIIPDQCATVLGSLRYFALGVPKLLLAPYAWVFAPYFDIHYLLYPGQWLFYLFVLPLAFVGTYYVLKEDRREFFLVLFPIALNFLVFLLAYEGSVPRQRLHLEPLFILLAVYGVEKKGKKWFYVAYYVLLTAFIIAHLISIRGHWAKG
jgi:hypothetical protein